MLKSIKFILTIQNIQIKNYIHEVVEKRRRKT